MCSRSMAARTSRDVHRRLSIQMSPFGRIAIRMLPFSLCSAVSASALVDADAGFLDERRRDDEEDEQVEHEVEHRRQVDAGVIALLRCALTLMGRS